MRRIYKKWGVQLGPLSIEVRLSACDLTISTLYASHLLDDIHFHLAVSFTSLYGTHVQHVWFFCIREMQSIASAVSNQQQRQLGG